MEWIRRNETKCQCFAAMMIAMVSLMHTGAANPHGIPEIDAGIFNSVGMVLQRDGMPYVDAFDHKGPLLYVINALAMGMGSWHMVAVFEAIALFAGLFFIFRIARLRAGFFSSLLIMTLCAWLLNRDMLDYGNLTEEYALPWIALAAWLFLRFFQKGEIGRRELLLIGFCLSMVVALRPNVIAVWAVGIPITIWKLVRQQRLCAGAPWALGGFAAGLAPFLLWMMARGALTSCWESYITFNLHYTQRFPELARQLALLRGNQDSVAVGRYSVFLYFAKKGAWQAFALCILAMAGRRQWRDSAAWAGLAMLAASLLVTCMSAMPFGHYGMAMLPALAYPLAVFCGALEQLRFRNAPAGRYVLVLGSMAFAMSVIFSGVHGYIALCRQSLTDSKHIYVAQTAAYISSHTTSDDKILVYGDASMSVLYPLSGRLPASRYLYQYPIIYLEPERQEEFIEQIGQSLPKMIVTRKDIPEYDPVKGKMEEFMQIHAYKAIPRDIVGTDELVIYVLPDGENR